MRQSRDGLVKKDHFNTQTTLNDLDETKVSLDKKNSLFTNNTSFIAETEEKTVKKSPKQGRGLFEENSIQIESINYTSDTKPSQLSAANTSMRFARNANLNSTF